MFFTFSCVLSLCPTPLEDLCHCPLLSVTPPKSPTESWDTAFLTLLLALFIRDLSYGKEVGVGQGRQEEEGEMRAMDDLNS